jgi:hypothetical protein
MRSRSLFTAAVVTAAAVGTISFNAPARAQHARDAEMIGFHQLCERGDRRACIRFGIMLARIAPIMASGVGSIPNGGRGSDN